MTDQEFGLERAWFERVGYYSQRDLVEYVHPAKRTIAQKFEVSTLNALTELKHLHWYTQEQENRYLSSSFYHHLKSLTQNTMNAAAFVLLGACIHYDKHTLVYSPSKHFHSVHELLDKIRKPSPPFQEWIHKYGITIPDLLRYLFYMRPFFPPEN